jgi:hypothetical protein
VDAIDYIEQMAGQLAEIQAAFKRRAMGYQVDAKETVAAYYGLSWDEVNLPYQQWAELRERYERESGKRL